MEDCIFCRIIKGDIPSTKVYEDDSTLAFLDIMPANKGHTLIIPKSHHKTLMDIPTADLNRLTQTLQRVTLAVVKATGAEGTNIVMNNNEVAGQAVPHAHFHIVPRFKEDGISNGWPTKKYGENELQELKDKIVKAIG